MTRSYHFNSVGTPRKFSRAERDTFVEELWIEEFVRYGLCMICGNSGVIDTRPKNGVRMVSGPRGQLCSGTAHCICSNGRRLKQLGHKLP